MKIKLVRVENTDRPSTIGVDTLEDAKRVEEIINKYGEII
jgi:CMP-2-keto-3-deoxyoctulosonic acid synthetase